MSKVMILPKQVLENFLREGRINKAQFEEVKQGKTIEVSGRNVRMITSQRLADKMLRANDANIK